LFVWGFFNFFGLYQSFYLYTDKRIDVKGNIIKTTKEKKYLTELLKNHIMNGKDKNSVLPEELFHLI
jgi:hypothetical protein